MIAAEARLLKPENARRREYDFSRYREKVAGFVAYLGGACVECGATDRLEIDHVDPATKSFTASNA
jgi:hypothetical protein